MSKGFLQCRLYTLAFETVGIHQLSGMSKDSDFRPKALGESLLAE